MGILTGLFEQRVDVQAARMERRDAIGKGSTAWILQALGEPSVTGISVSPEGSLAYSAVLSCVRVLAEGVATLPCLLYERYQADGREAKRRAASHPVYTLLHNAPNEVITAFELYEMGMAQVLLWGNFYAEIEWDDWGQARALWPLPAWRMRPEFSRQGKTYELWLDGEPAKTFADYQVLHVAGFGYDGVEGKSMIRLARESVGLGLATQRYGSAFFRNGARPGGVLEHPGHLGDDAHERLRKSWMEQHEGLEHAQRLAILEEGMKYSALAVPPEDAQFLQTRQFQRSEVAGIFRVPPHMIGDLERATFSNIEQQSIDFYRNTLQPWLRRWEQRLMRSLLVGRESTRYYVEFLADALLRADTQARYQAYSVGRQWGWLSVNDIRQRENLNPIPGGEEYLVPLNMMEAGAGQGPAGQSPAGIAGQEEGERATSRSPVQEGREERELRTANSRRRLARSYRGTLEHVGQRIVNREVNDVRQAARRFLGEGDVAGFKTWLFDFDRNHANFVLDYLRAPLSSYLDLVKFDVERELEREIPEARLEQFREDYVTGRRNQWMGDLMREVRVRSAPPRDEVEPQWEALVRDLEAWLSERKDGAAATFAHDETVRGGNAMAVAMYAAAGVLRKVWRAFGESCPWCQRMDGKVVETGRWFLPAGEGMEDGEGKRFESIVDVGHPPLHGGCDCVVMAEV